MANTPLKADLVLEGGGAKSIALIGAISVLEEAGYTFPRVVGSSAGALVGALVAAGMSAEKMRDIMIRTPCCAFSDKGVVDRMGSLGRAASLFFEQGIFEGEHLKKFLRQMIPQQMHTFAGLRLPPDPESALPAERQYRLTVLASDITRNRLVRLPGDYWSHYHLDRDAQSVIDAVRASMSIPFFFEPAHLHYTRVDEKGHAHSETSTLVEGGMLSHFPVDAFDRVDGRPARWPTFGIKLSGRPGQIPMSSHIDGPLTESLAMVEALVGWRDRAHFEDPSVLERTIFVDTTKVASFDFGLLHKEQEYLFESGREAAMRFLKTWDLDEHLERRAAKV